MNFPSPERRCLGAPGGGGRWRVYELSTRHQERRRVLAEGVFLPQLLQNSPLSFLIVPARWAGAAEPVGGTLQGTLLPACKKIAPKAPLGADFLLPRHMTSGGGPFGAFPTCSL